MKPFSKLFTPFKLTGKALKFWLIGRWGEGGRWGTKENLFNLISLNGINYTINGGGQGVEATSLETSTPYMMDDNVGTLVDLSVTILPHKVTSTSQK